MKVSFSIATQVHLTGLPCLTASVWHCYQLQLMYQEMKIKNKRRKKNKKNKANYERFYESLSVN
jgi:hypothetical protein